MTFQPPYVVFLLAPGKEPLPATLSIPSPLGEVTLKSYSVRGRDEYDLLRKIFRLSRRGRRKLFRKFPELTEPRLPQGRRLARLISQVIGTPGPTEPEAEEDPQ